MSRVLLVVVLLGALALGTWWLRSQTMTRTGETPPRSETRVSFVVRANGAEKGPERSARALFVPCAADVPETVVEPVHRVADDPPGYAAVFEPALSDALAQKLTGCLSDLRVPHLRASEVEVAHSGLEP